MDGGKQKLGTVESGQNAPDDRMLREMLEEALISSNETIEMMKSILNKSEAMIFTSDLDTDEIIFMSDSMKRHFGLDDDVVGVPCYKILQEDRDARCEWCACHKLDKDPQSVIVWEEYKQSTQSYYQKTDRYVDWPGGKKVHIQYIVDVTEMKRQKNDIEIHRKTLQDIINSIPELVFCKDADYRYRLFNTACAEFLNADMNFLIGKNDVELGFPDEVIKTMRSSDERVYAGESKVVYDSWIPSPDGQLRYYETSKAPIMQDGAVIGLVGISHDITEKYRMEQENELQLSKLNLMVKATRIGLWDMEVVEGDPINPENVFLWSDELRHMLGFEDINDFPNILSSWSDRLHPEDKGRTLDAFEKHLTDITGKTPYDIEYRLLKKDGVYAYFRASGETIRDENGNPLRVAGALMDVTETKNMLLEIEKRRMEAETANKAKSDFLSMVSHEIRSPMNVILGVTEIQLQAQRHDEDTERAFDKIYASGDLLLGIINDILDLSKIEAGKLELLCDKYEITSLISDAAQLNMMRIGSKPLEFELYVDENTPAVLFGDELRIKQILNNLLSNAYKYTEEGTVRLSIHAEPGDDDDYTTIVFRVSDTGQGMTEEELDKLFDEYSRFNTEANRTTEGTGLGMSIVRNLVRLMNGKIDIDSAKGKGTTAAVWLPQRKASSEVLGIELSESLQQFRTSGRALMKRTQISREQMAYGSVLVVDDVESNLYVARGLLAPYGLKIETASSGIEAIDKIRSGNVYDIVFMDHMMPFMDGVEATKKIRDMGYRHPIVALTANAVIGQADVFLKNGFDDFMPKPIDIRQLNSILNELIRDKRPPEAIDAARPQAAGNKEDACGAKPSVQVDPQLIEAFIRDAEKSIDALESISKKQYPLSDEDNRMYDTHVHGMKSALANVGKKELSETAFRLEIAAQNGEIEIMQTETTAFIDSLRAVVNSFASEDEAEDCEISDENMSYLRERLLIIKAACADYDVETANDTVVRLRGQAWSRPTHSFLAKIAGYLLSGDFDDIIEAMDGFLKGNA